MTEKTHVQSEEKRQWVSLDTGVGNMSFGRAEYLTIQEAERKREALRFFRMAHQAQMKEEFDEAVHLYGKSIETYPTAEAHTFLGWTYSFIGMTDEAIEECHRAIAVDPDFGNPYNDIGAYLIEKGDLDGAIPWLKKAMEASRYECYFYPHFNLGRVYEARGRYFEALREYKAAINLNPGYTIAVKAFRILQSKLN